MEKTRKEKSEELTKFWQYHINQWSDSGLTQTEYCRQNDLSRDRFAYWKTKFNRKKLPVEFAQINAPSMIIGQTGLKLNIGPALQIEIPDGFSRTTLEHVLRTLNVLQ